MFVGGGMVDNRRLKLLHDTAQAIGARDIADLRMKCQVREGLLQLPVNLKQRRSASSKPTNASGWKEAI
jgi:hypothetical protein